MGGREGVGARTQKRRKEWRGGERQERRKRGRGRQAGWDLGIGGLAVGIKRVHALHGHRTLVTRAVTRESRRHEGVTKEW